MAVTLARLPRYLILEPVSTVRLEMELTHPSCEIDVELQNPEPGRSFVLLIGKQGGPHLQRMRLSGRARIFFDPKAPGIYVLMLANPQKDPLVLRLRARNLRHKAGRGRPLRPTVSAPARRHRTANARRSPGRGRPRAPARPPRGRSASRRLATRRPEPSGAHPKD